MAREMPVSPKRLIGFSKIFGKFFGDSKGAPVEPLGETLPISIRFGSRQLRAEGPGHISLTQVFDVSRSEGDSITEKVKLRVIPELKVLMDESSKGETIKFRLTHEDSGTQENSSDSFEIEVDLKSKKRLKIESNPYDHRWTTDLKVRVEVAE
jgi:hypothetical protein